VTIALAATASSVSEAAGTVPIAVVLTTSDGNPTTSSAMVSFSVGGGTAVGSDYVGIVGTLIFPAGTASGSTQNINVTIVNDTINEPDETFVVTLVSATGAVLGNLSHTVTIVD